MSTKDNVNLFRFEYLDEEVRRVDWVWLTPTELHSYMDDQPRTSAVIYRQASTEEEELYDEAYNDGYGVAMIQEALENDNGVTFRMNAFGEGIAKSFDTTKMFKCAMCNKHKDFDTEVASTGGMYLTKLVNDILWHVCAECVSLQAQIEDIHIEDAEEGQS